MIRWKIVALPVSPIDRTAPAATFMKNARQFLVILPLAYGLWMVTTGILVGPRLTGPVTTLQTLALLAGIFLTLAGQILLTLSIPTLAREARWSPIRMLAIISTCGAIGLVIGVGACYEPVFGLFPLGRVPEWGDTAPLRFLSAACILIIVWRVPIEILRDEPAPFFLTDRSHASSGDARRCLVTASGHALLVSMVLAWTLTGQPPYPKKAILFGVAYSLGLLASVCQRYPQRAMGLVPLSAWISCLALMMVAGSPNAEWPVWPLGFALGLAHPAARSWLLVSVPVPQRGMALSLYVVMQLGGAALGGTLFLALGPGGALVLGLLLAVAATTWLFRELMEQLLEFVLLPFYPIRGYGPGMLSTPMRGPILVVANHAAWFDPIWLAKVIPVQMRPMMTSRFFDLPVIRFLVRRAFLAIRVQETGFRREAPEIQEAIAAIDRGQNVLIFPEGWLRRKEERPLRRFGQGVYQILREKPSTPVVACWIEGGWGSYTSFFNGPPTKNKKLSFLYPIRIGVSDPEVLSLDILEDHIKTRQHLMRAVILARTFIGLPAHPPPAFAVDEDDAGDETDAGKP